MLFRSRRRCKQRTRDLPNRFTTTLSALVQRARQLESLYSQNKLATSPRRGAGSTVASLTGLTRGSAPDRFEQMVHDSIKSPQANKEGVQVERVGRANSSSVPPEGQAYTTIPSPSSFDT